jgi:hypothetical protein
VRRIEGQFTALTTSARSEEDRSQFTALTTSARSKEDSSQFTALTTSARSKEDRSQFTALTTSARSEEKRSQFSVSTTPARSTIRRTPSQPVTMSTGYRDHVLDLKTPMKTTKEVKPAKCQFSPGMKKTVSLSYELLYVYTVINSSTPPDLAYSQY